MTTLTRARAGFGTLPGWARSAVVVAVGVGLLAVTATLTGQIQLTSSGTTQAAVRLLLPILFAALGGLWILFSIWISESDPLSEARCLI